jgi:S1-C subfamily serine protease
MGFTNMLRFFFLTLILFVAGCESVPVKDAKEIQTESQLTGAIRMPVNLPVAIYVDSSKPETGVNFYGKMKEAAQLVLSEYFSEADDLKPGRRFQYLLKFKANSVWNAAWGRWESVITVEVVSNQGEVLYSKNQKNASSNSRLYDFSAVFNAFAKVVKETVIDFLNKEGAENLATSEIAFKENTQAPLPIKKLLKDLKPISSGTGFYIDHDGTVMTANHVVQNCMLVEIRHNNETFTADVQHRSRVLDIAVLRTETEGTPAVSISDKKSEAILGKNIFVTGFPLQGILSDSPSLTIGTVSSLGGLKGSTGSFMFSAPVQPGNSGSAIVDYSGNLVGMVASSLNQKMLLEKLDASSQNVNFAIDLSMLKKFMNKNGIAYTFRQPASSFENATIQAVAYTNQVLCYK